MTAATTADRTELRQPVTFEREGIGRIPEGIRRSTPWTFALIFAGTGFNLPTIIFGWIPVAFGLGFWPAITSMGTGTAAALIPMTPLILIGSRTATNNATSSGAHFGVKGRLIGSALALALMLIGAAIAIWSGGQILVAAAARLFHTSTGTGALAVSYSLLAVLTVLIACWGYHLLAKTALAVTIFGVIATALMLAAFTGHLHPSYRGGSYALGSFTATWLLSALSVGVGGVMNMATVPGDWTRYIPGDRRYPPRQLLPLALAAVVITYMVPMGIGALVATSFAHPAAAFPRSLTAAAPGWYAVILVPFALFGGLVWSAGSVYSSGLDLSAIFSWLRRPAATTVMSVVSVGLVLAGSLVWNAADSMSAVSLILLAASAPWAAVIGVGYLRCGGRYAKDDLQVFNQGRKGGIYWYRAGWNPAAVVAWAAGCLWGLLTVQTTLYTGPWAMVAGGVDLSFAGSFLIAAVLYFALEASAQRLRRRAARPALVAPH